MNRLYIAPYKLGSESAKALALALDVKRITMERRLRLRNVIVNWGRTDVFPLATTIAVLNPSTAVTIAKNKLLTLEKLTRMGVSCPRYTTNRDEVIRWLSEDKVVYVRHTLTGQSGQGIKILTSDDTYNIPYAPLYTEGVVKTHEYRVHVAFGNIIDFSKKRRRNEHDANPYIKNLDNGWVFCRDNVTLPYDVMKQSTAAVAALGLDFGAVDIVYKESASKAYVLEVNTAPGLEGTTLERYINSFKKHIGDKYGPYKKASDVIIRAAQRSRLTREVPRYQRQSYWNRV